MKFNLKEDGSKFVRVIAWNQIWLRSGQINPIKMIGGEASSTGTDIGNRRLRFLAYSQISNRFMIVTHFGTKNQTFTNGGAAESAGTGGYDTSKKPRLFFHDSWNEYAVVLPKKDKKFSLSLGGGLHYYMGLLRATMSSTLIFLTINSPISNWPLIENSYQFAGQMGLFAKGKYGKLEYRKSYNKPFVTNLVPVNTTTTSSAAAVDYSGNTKWSKAGYFDYQFLDQEANVLPYRVGSYVGTKKVFNIGAGFYTAPDATRTSVNNTIEKHNINLFAAGIFLNLPIGKKENKMAFTDYPVFYDYDFAPNYLRNIGIMIIGSIDPNFTGNRAIAGPGNAQATVGTGTIWYTQAGVLLPTKVDKPKVRVQPFGAVTYKNFDALDKSSTQFDLGTNFFLDGQHAKITAQYSTRPVYTAPATTPTSLGDFILQLQIYL